MAPTAAAPRRFPLIPVVTGILVVLVFAIGAFYLMRPPAPSRQETTASAEARAYLPNLALSDVAMEATENFMKQQVVEIKGTIADNGPKALRSVEVYCLFYDVNGKELQRERLPIVNSKNSPLKPQEKRHFRLPFDAVPDGWNQAVPKMVIAQITFAQ